MRSDSLNPKGWSVRTRWIVGVLVVLLLLSASVLDPTGLILGLQDEVDIHSGRVWHACLVFCIPIVRYSVESSLTRALPEEERITAPPAWRRVVLVSPFVGISPHFAFHGAIAQIHRLETIWEEQGFTTERRLESARRLLRLWQRDETYYSGAERYLTSLKQEGKVADTDFPESASRDP